jgi:ABC-type polysaccharide/polyol phosphate export permease
MRPPFSCFWLIPLLVGEGLLVVGLAWGLSALNVLYRDVTQILEFITLAWFYATPIIYSIDLPLDFLSRVGMPNALYFLNPMSTLVYASRRACLGIPTDAEWVMPSSPLAFGIVVFVAMSIAAPLAGQALFRRLETRAVDTL